MPPVLRVVNDETAAAGSASSGAGVLSGGVDGGLAPGAMLGRYVLVRELGAGGMGVVYEAHDAQLERSVAVKVLREAGEGRRARLVREAQALARVSHANVLVVHEAAEQGGVAYIVTELVDGHHLGEWLAAAPRSRDALLDAFAAAARGLAAAHAAGLVHRDFKPANVLVGRDGRVRVADFGIVRHLAADAADGDAASPAPATDGLTRTGAAMGTPAYMAPEQARGEPADARADQYSFCVALCEALTGERPTRGVSARAGLPPALRRLLERGLASEPARRFPSMAAVLDALERARALPRRRRRAALLGGGALLLLALALAGQALRGDERPLYSPCDAVDSDLAGVWDLAVRAQAEAAFLATGQGFAAASWRRTRDSLDRWALRWQQGRRQACAATHERHEQSEAVLDLRMRCLDRRRLELGRFTTLLQAADGDLVAHDLDATAALTDPAACSEGALLAARTPRPGGAEVHQRLDHIEALLAEGRLQLAAGRARLGYPPVAEALAEARAIAWAPALAETLFVDGSLRLGADDYEAAVRALREALVVGDAAGDDQLRLDTALKLIRVEGSLLERHERIDELATLARALIARLGGDERLVADLDEELLNAHMRTGKIELARRYAEEMLALRTRLYPAGDPIFARTYRHYGRVVQVQGELDLAMEYIGKGLAIDVERLGADHPELSRYYHVIGIIQQLRGEYDAGIAATRRTLELLEPAVGPENGRVARTYHVLGNTLRLAGRHDEALAAYARALATHEKTTGPDSLIAADTRTGIALSLLALGRVAEAEREGARALAAYRARPAQFGAAWPLDAMSRILARRGQARAAYDHANQAVQVVEADVGAESNVLVGPLCTRSEMLVALGHLANARADLERALGILAQHPRDPADCDGARRALGYPAAPSRSSQR